jgi:hypothetical protein
MAARSRPGPRNGEQLLEAVRQLPPAELREFQRLFTAWQAENGAAHEEERALGKAAQARLPAADERRLRRLIAKSEDGTLTPKGLTDYQDLARRAEQCDVLRAEALAELARRKGRPGQDVSDEVGSMGRVRGT